MKQKILSALFSRKMAYAIIVLLGTALMVALGGPKAGAATGLIVGMAWVADEQTIKYLASIGLVDSTTGLFTPKRIVVAKTGDYTVTGLEACGTLFTTRGAAGAVNFTLPAASVRFAGLWYEFLNLVDQNMTLTGTPADTLVVDGDLTADSLAASTASHKIGARMTAFCDGTNWIVAGTNVGPTYTVAT